MRLEEVTSKIANVLKDFDSTYPVFKNFNPGIGPFGEPQLVSEISNRLNKEGLKASTHRTPDLKLEDYAIEVKIARPFGDNGKVAENWSVNLRHPYEGNVSAIGDIFKLRNYKGAERRAIFVIGYEHSTPKIPLEPLILAFEAIAREVYHFDIGTRISDLPILSRRSDIRCDFRSVFIVREREVPSNHVSMDASGSGRIIFDTAMAMISLDSASVRCFFSMSTMPRSFTIFIMGMKGPCIRLLLGRTLLIFLIPPSSFLPTYL